MRKTLLALAAASAATLSGCSGVTESITSVVDNLDASSGREVTQTNVMGNIWQRTEVWPWENNPMKVKEGLSEHAKDFCAKQQGGMGMQPLDQTITWGKKDDDGKLAKGASATLRFRCVERRYWIEK